MHPVKKKYVPICGSLTVCSGVQIYIVKLACLNATLIWYTTRLDCTLTHRVGQMGLLQHTPKHTANISSTTTSMVTIRKATTVQCLNTHTHTHTNRDMSQNFCTCMYTYHQHRHTNIIWLTTKTTCYTNTNIHQLNNCITSLIFQYPYLHTYIID